MPPPLLPLPAWWLGGAVLLAVGFALRVAVHFRRSPGGVDTWYYLAYADAVRRRPGLDVRLPQYLLQDERQSYPPLFPTLLALLPGRWLRRWFWTVAPALDCAHLLLLYYVAYRLTANVPVAVLAGALYAFTPQLISETRNLNPRAFGSLLNSVAILLAFKALVLGGAWPWLVAAILAAATLALSSAAMAVAYGFVALALAVVFLDVRHALVVAAGVLVALVFSGGHLVRVVRNYVHAVAYWRRNRHLYGAHPVRHSPIYGKLPAAGERVAARPGFLSGSVGQELARLLGESPFLIALPFAPYDVVTWGPRLFTWAVSLVLLSLLATLLPPLRAFGPGRSYMKAAVFPTAYLLAAGMGGLYGIRKPVGLATLVSLVLSALAIAFFYYYVRSRPTEHTASTPEALVEATRFLAAQPPGGVFVMPYMYADYVCYNSGKPVLWGGHCGDLSRFQALAPVISRPLPELLRENGVTYVLLDSLFVTPAEIGMEGRVESLGRWGSFAVHSIGWN